VAAGDQEQTRGSGARREAGEEKPPILVGATLILLTYHLTQCNRDTRQQAVPLRPFNGRIL
jgi:hypothetical protein